ncbi:MAG TPA: bifunctional precorrin-2 dehydrogenase/sirohydrochlorin ferrochelatase [Thermodesulfovibrionales bacterium]|nr:bifunctional precorrin-2 dehydrogenase/sirohydrochlorin ferrochelatase [Thermodesulfovibrionales bacterium]
MSLPASRFSYPLFLDLTGKECIIVGGGKVAERKCSTLLKTGAAVTVISPDLTVTLGKYKDKGLVLHKQRLYRKGDIETAFLVIAATDSQETNRRVADDATVAGKLLNVVDTPSLCNCIMPSVVRRGLLTIAISTSGASPAMAKAIRKEIEELYGPEFARYLKAVKMVRDKAVEEIPNKKERERFLKGLIEKFFER